MSLILNIETATPVCSIALGDSGNLLGSRETVDGRSHASHLTILISELLEECSKTLSDLDAIAVSKGPGSYTGLRIGVSTAKGLCYALDKPLISINSLRSMANNFIGSVESPTLLCPMLDARRMEVYMAIYDAGLAELVPTTAEIVTEDSFSQYLKSGKVVFFGDGAEKCRPLLGANVNADFVDSYQISASSMVTLSATKYTQEGFEDVAYFEPYYLKDFVAGPPKKMI